MTAFVRSQLFLSLHSLRLSQQSLTVCFVSGSELSCSYGFSLNLMRLASYSTDSYRTDSLLTLQKGQSSMLVNMWHVYSRSYPLTSDMVGRFSLGLTVLALPWLSGSFSLPDRFALRFSLRIRFPVGLVFLQGLRHRQRPTSQPVIRYILVLSIFLNLYIDSPRIPFALSVCFSLSTDCTPCLLMCLKQTSHSLH